MTSPVVPPDAEGLSATRTHPARPGTSHGRIPGQRRPAPPGSEPAPERATFAQPVAGTAGLVLVLAVGLVAGAAGGPQGVLERVGPWTTFCLPVLAVVALWWAGRPLQALGAAAAGLVLTLGILAAGVVSLAAGQAIIGDADPGHLFSNATGAAQGQLVTFPFTLPLAGLVFVIMLQLTLVCRKWPFAKMGPIAGGLSALGTSWVLGVAAYALLVNWDAVPAPAREAIGLSNPGGPVDALDLLAFGLCVVIWQLAVFLLLDGWPVSRLGDGASYLVAANAVSLGGGYLTWLLLDSGLDRTVPEIAAVAGAAVAGILIAGLLFEGWPARLLQGAGSARAGLLAVAAVWSVAVGYALYGLGNAFETWDREPVHLWSGVIGLNFIGAMVILYVAVWRRWPVPAAVAPAEEPEEASAAGQI
jgi:hypothetical protein